MKTINYKHLVGVFVLGGMMTLLLGGTLFPPTSIITGNYVYAGSNVDTQARFTLTNQVPISTCPDMSLSEQTFITNQGPVNIFAPTNVDSTGKTWQHTIFHVRNTGASDIAIRLGAGNYVTNVAGTVMRVTNWSDILIDIIPGFQTNMFIRPKS